MIGKITVTVEANNSNFLTWQNDGDDWKGTDGKEFQELRNRYMERKKTAFN